jgi:hypothetical protein
MVDATNGGGIVIYEEKNGKKERKKISVIFITKGSFKN